MGEHIFFGTLAISLCKIVEERETLENRFRCGTLFYVSGGDRRRHACVPTHLLSDTVAYHTMNFLGLFGVGGAATDNNNNDDVVVEGEDRGYEHQKVANSIRANKIVTSTRKGYAGKIRTMARWLVETFPDDEWVDNNDCENGDINMFDEEDKNRLTANNGAVLQQFLGWLAVNTELPRIIPSFRLNYLPVESMVC